MRSMTLVASLLVAATAWAEFPYPANPAPCGTVPTPECIEASEFHRYLSLPASAPPVRPNDFRDNWKISSDTTGDPAIDGSAQELFGVTGASVDLAWQTTTGRPDVIIAVLDSGIRWGESFPDLVNKYYLNRGELPVPEGSVNEADAWDRNGDGVFNVRDYMATGGFDADGRVSDQNGNGMIDPEDLIFLFTDDVDDDGNGYTDDISGWDFFEDDNNALDEVRYSHGTGESLDSAAEADNGIGGVGTCPNCMLLEVRVGDSFVSEVSDFAQGVLFAVDSGARVVQEALGTINNSAFAQAAIDYAYERGTVVMASAADEQSRHNNFPAAYRNTVMVNSVTRFFDDGGFTQSPPSYLYLNGCTNFSGHIAVAVPSTACSSEATGLSSGMAGLIVSAALDEIARGNLTPYPAGDGFAPFPLSAEEVKQIITTTADDINFDARDDVDPPLPRNYATDIPLPGVSQSHERFASIAGFDQYFGYGRINAASAVERVRAGRIPPEAAIAEPAWFAYLRPQASTLAITGRVAATRATSFRYVVEVAGGVQPAEASFVEVFASEELSETHAGELAQLDLSQVATLMPNGASGPPVLDDGSQRGDPDRFTFTVRVRVFDDTGQMGEDRRTLFLHDDPQLIEGYPRFLGADGAAPPKVADLDGDGREELILATSEGEVHALRLDGSELPGWPVRTDPIEVHAASAAFASGAVPIPDTPILGSPAIGDLDRDGRPEVVAADLKGQVYVWRATGERVPGFPVRTLPQYSHAWRSERDTSTEEGLLPDKSNRKNRDNRLSRGFVGGATLANLDGSADGSLEILAGAMDRHIYAWFADGTPVPGWPAMLRDPEKVASVDPVTNGVTLVPNANAEIGTTIIRVPAVGDLDGDGDLEVVSVVNEGYRGLPNAIFDGLLANLLVQSGLVNPGNTRVYALHHDGTRHGPNGIDRGWNPDAFIDGWPVVTALVQTDLLPSVATGSNGSPAIADLDEDGSPEVVTFSAVGPVYVFRGDGSSFLGLNRGRPAVLRQLPLGAESNSDDGPTFGALGGPAIAPLGGADGALDIIAPTSGLGRLVDAALPARQTPSDNHMSAWRSDGALLPAFPRETNDLQFFVVPVVADITGDGLPEVLQGSGVRDLHAVDGQGRIPAGWPKLTAGWTVAPPVVADFDDDGKVEVMHVTREGYLFAWRSEGDACGFHPWRQAQHDEHGTSNVATDARPPASIPQPIAISTAPTQARFSLESLPGDDGRCGDPALVEVRFSTDPIVDDVAFASAEVAATARLTISELGPELVAEDDRFAGKVWFLAARSRDAAGNLARWTGFGAVSFPQAPTVTPTATPTPSATSTPSATPTPSATVTASATATATATPTSTATATPSSSPTRTPTVEPSPTLSPTPGTFTAHGGDGCAIASTARAKTRGGLGCLGFGIALFGLRRLGRSGAG